MARAGADGGDAWESHRRTSGRNRGQALFREVDGAAPHRLHREVDAAESRDHDHRHVDARGPQVIEDLDGGHVPEREIGP
jgi:hypothetical protein